MAFCRYLSVFITTWCLLTFCVVSNIGEPVCSKFDYEAKVLEKMIRMEIKVEQMFEEMKNAKESMEAKMSEFKVELETMQQKTSQSEQNMESKFSSAINTLKDSIVTQTPTVAFNARRTGTNTLSVSTGATMVFNDVILNAGTGYSSDTGVFTASYGGLYYFTTQMCNTKNSYVHFAIVVNDDKLTSSTQVDKDYYPCTSSSAMTILEPNDRVWIKIISTSKLHQDAHRFNSFCGALIHK